MEEFIFGTLANDTLRLIFEKAQRSGVRHAHQLTPPDPNPNQSVVVTVQVGADVIADAVALYYTIDGSVPLGARGIATVGTAVSLTPISRTWDTLAWGYTTTWQATLPPQPNQTVLHYRISAWADDAPEVFADWPNLRETAEAAARVFFEQKDATPTYIPHGDPSTGQIFELHYDTHTLPKWAQKALIYHIFVDRFSPSPAEEWHQTDNLADFMGGTLWGVADKLDYVQALGVDAIWLSPIFPSPTYHGYDATDYQQVAERYGGAPALRAVVEGAHARGLRVILDFAANHFSDQHPVFIAARSDPTSPYRNWFTWDDKVVGYGTFFGVASMPQIQLDHPAARAWMIDQATYWLREFDVDGFRLDYASGPGPDFWGAFRAACRAIKPDCFLFGEIVEPPDIQQEYIGRLDGALDFYGTALLRDTFAYQRLTEAEFWGRIAPHAPAFGNNFVLPTFLDNHDMNRFLFIAGNDVEMFKRAWQAQLTLPGPAILYYGNEVGLQQTQSTQAIGLEASRVPMVWDEAQQDLTLMAFVRQTIATRKALLG